MTLREMLEKATPRPWELHRDTSNSYTSYHSIQDAQGFLTLCVESKPVGYDGCDHWLEFHSPTEAELIITLVNNAESFVAMWEAAAHASCIRDRRGELLHPRLARVVEALRDLMEGDSE